MSHCASLLSRTEVRQLEAERLDRFRAARQVGRDAQPDQNVFQTALPEQRNVLYRIKGRNQDPFQIDHEHGGKKKPTLDVDARALTTPVTP